MVIFPVDFQVGWFNTTVNGYEGTRVTVPNRRILDGTVIDKTNKRFRVCQKYLVSWPQGTYIYIYTYMYIYIYILFFNVDWYYTSL